MAKYDATIKLTVSCSGDGAAAKAVETLKKFLDSTIVKASLIGYGVTLLAPPDITIAKKKT